MAEKESLYSKNLTNWAANIANTDKNGPHKKKRGRKKKQKSVQFKTARQIRHDYKERTEDGADTEVSNDELSSSIDFQMDSDDDQTTEAEIIEISYVEGESVKTRKSVTPSENKTTNEIM